MWRVRKGIVSPIEIWKVTLKVWQGYLSMWRHFQFGINIGAYEHKAVETISIGMLNETIWFESFMKKKNDKLMCIYNILSAPYQQNSSQGYIKIFIQHPNAVTLLYNTFVLKYWLWWQNTLHSVHSSSQYSLGGRELVCVMYFMPKKTFISR